MLRWYFYGEVYFTTTQRRNQANAKLDAYVTNSGFVAGLWALLVGFQGKNWVAGRVDITGTSDTGTTVPGIRFCYYTTSQAAANTAAEDVVKTWNMFQDTPSWWSYTAVTV
jgi:hypothetical protein